MPDDRTHGRAKLNRRQLLKLSLGGLGIAGGAIALQKGFSQGLIQSSPSVVIPPLPTDLPTHGSQLNPLALCRDFNYGTLKTENGRTIREFQITAESTDLQLTDTISYPVWDYNGRVPGPTLRATAGDRVRIVFLNQGGHAHTMHFHGIHPAAVDGIKPVRNNTAAIYEFDATPYGLHLYHCHIAPVARHISKGLHGVFIIDPPGGRPAADEMVMVMTGYDLKDKQRNDLYAFNGIPDYYKAHPIPIYQNQLVRLYLVNVIEYDPAVTFHLHATFFQVYPTGMTLTPSHSSDVITMGTAERHILEFAYPYPGKYMFHPHQDPIAEAGCMGLFDVVAASPN